jgi:surfeit locus 1 family protein
MARKSLLVPTLFTLGGLVLLLGLGTWQLERRVWKEGLIAAREAGLAAPPAPLPSTLAAAQPLEYHRVTATGRLLGDRALHLHAISAAGALGWHVLTPMRLDDGSAVLVQGRFTTDADAGAMTGAQSITGLLRLPLARRGWFVPDDRPAANEWFAVDLPAMAAADKLERLLPFYIDASGEPPPDLPNDHLQYAITWYALAAVLVLFYILVLRRRRGEQT